MRSRRWMRPLAGVLLAAAVPVGVSGTATADAADKYGWWYKLKPSNSLTFVPAPPTVPTDSFYVANDATGPLAIAAVHFLVAGKGDATLKLTASQESTFTASTIAACPSKTVWDGAFAGGGDQRPEWDATACVPATVAADGRTATWSVGASFSPGEGEYDVILVPQGPVPFQVVVQQPGDDALTGYEPGQQSLFTEGEAGAVTDPAVTGAEAGGGDFGAATSFDPGPAGGGATFDSGAVGGLVDLAERPTQTGAAGASGGDAGATGGSAGQVALPSQRAVSTDDGQGDRVLALILLAGIAGALWWLGGVRAPAAAGATTVGGIGRFARPRLTPPNRL